MKSDKDGTYCLEENVKLGTEKSTLGNCDRDGDGDNNDDEMQEGTDEHRGFPVDRGWAWAVLAGVAWYLFLFGAVRKNFGLFFVAYQEHYDANASVTSLVATMQNIIFSVSSLLVMTLGMHFMSNRTAIMIGSIFKTVATIIAALSKDVRVLFISIGILDGIGISFTHNPIIAMLGEYFLKKRGMANGLAFCFASFGALVFAPILTTLFEVHGYVGTILVAAGMSFNCCVTGVLLRPLTSFRKKSKVAKSGNCSDVKQREALMMKEVPARLNNGDRSPPFCSVDELTRKHVVKNRNQESQLFKMNSCDRVNALKRESKRIRTFSENNSQTGSLSVFLESLSHSDIALYASTGGIGGSVIDVHENVEKALSQTDDTDNPDGKPCCVSCKNQIMKVVNIIFDVSLFRNGVFPCILVMGFMLVGAGDCVLIMLPPYAKDIGLSGQQRGILMLLFGCFDLFSRIILAIIADRQIIKRTNILVITSSVLGIACHSLRFFTSFGSMIVFSIITGCCTHLYWALHAVILVDYLTISKLKSSLGFITLCHGLAMSIFLPVAGLIRDNTGTFITAYHMLGSLLLIGAVMAFLIPYVDTYSKKKAEIVMV